MLLANNNSGVATNHRITLSGGNGNGICGFDPSRSHISLISQLVRKVKRAP